MTSLLRTSAEVSPPWLTEVLRADGLVDSARVVGFSAEPVGAGQMGECTRFVLDYDRAEANAPASVIGKFAATDETARQFMASTGYRNECCFYSSFARRLSVRSPRCSLAVIDDDGWFTLLLEDLAPAAPGDQLAGCTLEQVELAVIERVGLHAPLWGDAELASHACFAARTSFGADLVTAGLAAAVPGFLERYAHALDDAQVSCFERLATGGANWFGRRPAPTTLVHSDYRPDNLLFGTAAGGPPVAVVDWQGLALGSGLSDVGFIVGNALPVEVRRAHEPRLVQEYHRALTAAGVDLAWDRCWQDYRLGLLSGLLTTVFGAMYGVRTDRGDRMFELMAARHATQILDLGADEFLA